MVCRAFLLFLTLCLPTVRSWNDGWDNTYSNVGSTYSWSSSDPTTTTWPPADDLKDQFGSSLSSAIPFICLMIGFAVLSSCCVAVYRMNGGGETARVVTVGRPVQCTVQIHHEVARTPAVQRPSRGKTIECQGCRKMFTPSQSAPGQTNTCPSCTAMDEFSVTPEVSSKAPPEAPLPSYWANDRSTAKTGRLVPESEEVTRALQAMLDRTWKDQVTRDRDRAAAPLCNFQVVQVQRNENASKWDHYARTRDMISKKSDGCRRQIAKTSSEITDDPNGLAFLARSGLDVGCNELYLFHGTNPSAARAICDNSFQLSKAGSNAGTLYGPGVYFAEASSKADEYAEEDAEGIFAGLYAMLVCRVVCGNMRYTDEVKPDRDNLMKSIFQHRYKHSVLGDREKCRGTYREFVVFDRNQVYPEFVVIYRRVPRPPTE
eukprot:CAMPEP_0206427164 /NCGR_PEP_ID=MMETSP0324_2-20121206/4861_1 /ASSEMBLY_ACC=CAM_ASM_000836 /TAXON_ID=2866 /ORGANISM="Crypthecodinium cohnii, Strain Seligo" /LENGTH=430 /DNA_ID=CAMNT_0053892359 /DNA_START=39 /DNA_END=1331 /DNA_ORIENTATION=+